MVNLRILFLVLGFVLQVLGSEILNDANTLLLLHCNSSLKGENGEMPIKQEGVTYESGILESGAFFTKTNKVTFASSGNIDPKNGTIEFWIKPKWSVDDIEGHALLTFGGVGGIHIYLGNNISRIIFNRWMGGNKPEITCLVPEENLLPPEKWTHIAFSWDSNYVKCFINGDKKSETKVEFPLPEINETFFYLGSDFFEGQLNAIIDELCISKVARSEKEIAQRCFLPISVNNISITSGITKFLPTWRFEPTLIANTNFGAYTVPSIAAHWTSSNPSVAFVNDEGKIEASSSGNATLTATVRGAENSITVDVLEPILQPVYEPIDPYLSTPAQNALIEIPVVVIRYLPTKDGINLDTTKSPDLWDLGAISLKELKSNIDKMDKRIKFMLEEGSKFRGYKNQNSRPSLGYKVIQYITVYEQVPPSNEAYPNGKGDLVYWPDFFSIFERFNIGYYIENLGAKEVWFWSGPMNSDYPSYDPNIHSKEDFRDFSESNMSSPTTGDISNSWRKNDDLPIYRSTYVVYGYNFRRSQAEAVHNHGHQLESIYSHANWLQDENFDLFWKYFVGQDKSGNFITGRCGWTHMPPNTTNHYDYCNETIVQSDIEDWKPDNSGEKKSVNCKTWAEIPYNWPEKPKDIPQREESQWYIYWMQAMPGYENGISYASNLLTNWWIFTGEWDAAIRAGVGLYAPSCSIPSLQNMNPEQITANSAILQVKVKGGMCPVVIYFEWGESDQIRKKTKFSEKIFANDQTLVSITLNELKQCTVYHYRAVAVSGGGIAYGTDQTFETKGKHCRPF